MLLPIQRVRWETPQLQELILKGSSFEQGRSIGAAFADRIRTRAAAHERMGPQSEYGSDAERASECPKTNDPAIYLAQCAELLLYLQQHVPDLIALMRGVAAGADCTFEDIFRLNCQRAIAGTRPRRDLLESCSAVAASTDDAGMVLARTGDGMLDPARPTPALPGGWSSDLAVFKIVPRRGLRHILFGSVETLVAGDGMNEVGVCFGCLNLPYGPLRVGGGVPYNLVGRALAPRAETADHAVEILSGWRQASRAKCWPVVDGAGRSLAIEKCFARTGLARPAPDGVLAHANDYLSPQMQDLADGDQNSADRVRTLRDFVARARAAGTVTAATMEVAVQVHAEAGSICRHGAPGRSDRLGFTSSAAIYLPQQRKMRVLCGDHPCRGEFHELSFDF